jgi:hypothetical protein
MPIRWLMALIGPGPLEVLAADDPVADRALSVESNEFV